MSMGFDQNGFPKLNSPFVKEDRQIEIPWYRLLITLWNRSGGSSAGGLIVPSGVILDWGGPISSIPTGWLLCDGTAVSRNNFANLFAAIGVTWGAGDGLTSFNIPNLVGKFRKGTNGTPTPGTNGGNSSIVLDIGQMPSHAHGITDPGHIHTVTDPTHSHGQNVVSNNVAGTTGTQGGTAVNTTVVGLTAPAATGITQVDAGLTGITATNAAGSSNPVNIDPANSALAVIIKT